MMPRSSRIVAASAWLLAALTVVPAVGMAQLAQLAQPGAPAWLRARLDGRLDGRTRAAVERVIDSAYAAGVPAEPLVDKALEGSAKGSASDAIVQAVRMLAGNLARARQALGSASLSDELSAGAAALRAGVDARTLERLRHDRPGQPLSVTLGVLADLIGSGVPVSSATQTVIALAKAGVADQQLVAFRRDVERDVGMGAAPAAATVLHAGDIQSSLARDGVVSPGGLSSSGTGKRRP